MLGDASGTSYTPAQVAELYYYPTGHDGTGECIALLELGGGFNPTDLKNYWKQVGLSNTPTVTAVPVGNGSNSPGDPDGADGEVMLDIEVSGSIAPGSKIVVYFAENTDAGFLNAITTAIHDSTNAPSILSISWGGPESSWTQQAMTSMDEAFQSAAAMGVTVLVAAGDDGSTDGVTDGEQHVDFPSSSPNVLACGGTKLVGSWAQRSAAKSSGNEAGRTTKAQPEAASGGFFALPSYQSSAGVPASSNPQGFAGRGVPDVAGDADPTTGYNTLVDGQSGVIGGTSAVAPLWAGLIALYQPGHRASRLGSSTRCSTRTQTPEISTTSPPATTARLLRRSGMGSLHRPRLAHRCKDRVILGRANDATAKPHWRLASKPFVQKFGAAS